MSVYVDDLFPGMELSNTPGGRWPYATACHLFGDDEDELHRFAESIGLRRSWFQRNKSLDHYDLTRGMRSKAVRAGAIEVSREFVVTKIRERRERSGT